MLVRDYLPLPLPPPPPKNVLFISPYLLVTSSHRPGPRPLRAGSQEVTRWDLTQISFPSFYRYSYSFKLYLSSSCSRGQGVLPRLSLYKSNTRPHFLFTELGSWSNSSASSSSLKTSRPKKILSDPPNLLPKIQPSNPPSIKCLPS